MKLKISRKDKDGNISVIGKFAVLLDEKTEAMEVITTDTIQIDGITYTREQGVFQMQVVLGGHDSTGQFHAHPKFKSALVSFARSRPQDQALWNEYNFDGVEAFDWKTLKNLLQSKGVVQIIASNQWGMPDCISEIV